MTCMGQENSMKTPTFGMTKGVNKQVPEMGLLKLTMLKHDNIRKYATEVYTTYHYFQYCILITNNISR